MHSPQKPKQQPVDRLSQGINCHDQLLSSSTVRVDRNLDRFPLWVPSHRRKKNLEVRTITRELSQKKQMVVINPTAAYGDLTTDDYITFLGLLKYWAQKGHPVGNVTFSINQLAKILKKQWGGKTYTGLTKSLLRLRATSIEWHDSFFDVESQTFHKTLHPFNLLDHLELARREKDDVVVGEQGMFRFNANICRNLINDYTKPVLLDKLLSFHSEIAQILYIHLDLMLYGKTRYERCTTGLFADIGYSAKRYVHRANRKAKLLEAIEELNGAALPTGCIASIRLESTVDGKDDKLVAIKETKKGGKVSPVVAEVVEEITDQTFEHDTGNADLKLQAETLVQLFYQLFHGLELTTAAPARERAQAQALIQEVGYERAQFVVNRGKELSHASKFKAQVFGAVLSFKGRAIAEYDKMQKQKRRVAIGRPAPEPESSTLSHDEQVERNRQLVKSLLRDRRSA